MLRKQAARTTVPTQAELREAERLDALERLDVIDAPRNETFERIVSLIRNVFDVPIAIVSVIDGHRQLYKAWSGLTAEEAPRRDTFCNLTIQGLHPVVVPDASKDPRFAANPHVTGEPHIRFYAGVPLQTGEGHVVGTICAIDTRPRSIGDREIAMLSDLAAVTMDHMETSRLAATDALTGALSRRAFLANGARLAALAARHRYNLSLVAFDIDRFKAINDRFGHAAGDQVLADIGAACGQWLRTSDVFGRLGGDEFALILPHTDRQGALEVAKRLSRAIARMPFEPEGTTYPVTASFGVATLDIATTTIEELLSHADAALYRAKAEGRDGVVGWDNQRPGDERAVRRRVLKAGGIILEGGRPAADCTVRSLAESGAGIDVSKAEAVPDRFRLRIAPDGIERDCRVLSRTERHIEVEFLKDRRHRGAPIEAATGFRAKSGETAGKGGA